jgi:hypothetical protein
MSIYMTDEEVHLALDKYGDRGFDMLPQWLRTELQARNLPILKREPTYHEKLDTFKDAREHRIKHKEITLNDLKDKYLFGKSITTIT